MNQASEDVHVQVNDLVEHIFSIAKALQGAQTDDVIHFRGEKSKEVAESFINDTLPSSLFILKFTDSWELSRSLDHLSTPVSVVVIIKEIGPILQKTTLENQLQVINLPNMSSSFETLRSLVRFGVGSYFDAITSNNKSETISSTKKKINELVLSLKNLDQAIQIPDLSVTLHPVLKDAIAKGANLHNYTDFISDETLNDSTFLNNIQTIVNEWVRSIQAVTKMNREVSDGSAADEINFWTSMENTLTAIQTQLDSDGVQLSLEVLKYAKRYHATVSFFSDIEIKEAMATAADYNKLMKDFPLNELLVAEDLVRVEDAIVLILNHLKRLKLTSYPISRSLPFLEAISSDLERKLKPMVSNLMSLDFEQFNIEVQELNSIFDTWDRQAKEFTNVARELLRKRGEKFLFVRINSKTIHMKDRIQEALSFRSSHNELVDTLSRVRMDQKELDYAYNAIRDVDVFSGDVEWSNAKKSYDRRIHDIENQIVEGMRSTLDKSRNSNEMFQVFENYRFLLERPRIRAATQEYQSQLLTIVKEEISELQESFTKKSDESSLAALYDYPSIAFTLLWAKQVEAKLAFLMDRLELVLGKDWNLFAEGQKIYAEVTVFKKKLNTKPIFDDWLSFASERKIDGNILKLSKDKGIRLEVNFDENLMQLFKEVRALSYQGFQIPHNVVLSSRQVRKVYPHAVILTESIADFPALLQSIESLQEFKVLLVSERNKIYHLIEQCLSIKWETITKAHDLKHIEIQTTEHQQEQLISQLENSISDLQRKLEVAAKYKFQMNEDFQLLQTCQYDYDNFKDIISDVQKLIDQLNFEGFTNVDIFVSNLNTKLRKALVDRCLEEDLTPEKSVHQIVLGSRVSISPALERSKVNWLSVFQNKIETIRNQSKIFDRVLQNEDTNTSLMNDESLEQLHFHSSKFIKLIDEYYDDAYAFLKVWSQFEALWNFQSDEIYKDLDLDGWLEVLDEVKKSRNTFDTNETVKVCGSFIIDYNDAREKVRSRFLSWNRDLLGKFSLSLSGIIKVTHDSIIKGKKFLENTTLNLSSVKETIEVVTKVQEFKDLLKMVDGQISKLKLGQSTLTRQRFKFPSDFVYCEQIENDYEALSELVSKRSAAIDSQMDVIMKSIESEAQRLESSISQVQQDWAQSKPTSSSNSPTKSLEVLAQFEKNFTNLSERKLLVTRAAFLLSLPVKIPVDISSILEELRDLKSVWISIQGLWTTLDDLKAMRWYDVKPRQLRKELEQLLVNTRSMPVRVRQHEPFQIFLKNVTDLSNSQKSIISLKDDHVKERHLKSLFKKLNKTYKSTLTIGDIWSLNLVLNEGAVKETMEQAGAEKVLEDVLEGIRDYWEQASFETFNFHGQNLVKNMTALLEQSFNDSQSLESMRNSPYFRVFEDEAVQWESKLNNVHQIVDLWVEVQRQWIDLDGVFDSKSGIRRLLQSEASRFQMVSNEFISVLKRVFKHNFVIEILGIPDLQDIMQRISESLSRIAKALGEFLEKQRDLFPRFYFVGNEDLLEIIGNMGDFSKISKHLKKMFAGVNDLKVENDSITHVSSPEGEVLKLVDAISLLKYSRVDEWLTQLDYEIKHTLSVMVADSLEGFTDNKFEAWIGTYPAQVTLLTLQISWTKLIEESITTKNFDGILKDLESYLNILSGISKGKNKAVESFIIEILHQKNTTEHLKAQNIDNIHDFRWVSQQRFYYAFEESDYLKRLEVRQATKSFVYGFEYFGVMERLVSTPLLQKCFLAMTGALDQGLGGSPFGPAGTGKTETIKSLGQNLGKMVLVFNCDESFDFQAMGRLLLGICQVGVWGCFDEFNRLNKNILSAVSSQIEQIEMGLKSKSCDIELLSRKTPLKDGTGIFITMNPSYSGRANLPDNLKKLFRSFSMKSPDSEIIGEVLLSSWGFKSSKALSEKVVRFFKLLASRSSNQPHYDFGLRALKVVLSNAGKKLLALNESDESELLAIVRSINETISPRLLDQDTKIFEDVRNEVFGSIMDKIEEIELVSIIKEYTKGKGLICSDKWIMKLIQFYNIQESQQGVIVVGKAGRGKSTLWSSLLEVLSKVDGKDALHYIIDPKVLSKNELFGFLDPVTRDWSDGLLTSIIRKVLENLRGELTKRVWVVFDGDIDPIWVESLNSVLDDNKTLTLPNGERLQIPQNMRFIFEVDGLDFATPATVSRCGMVWVEEATITLSDVLDHELWCLNNVPISDIEEVDLSKLLILQQQVSSVLKPILAGHMGEISTFAMNNLDHVMDVDVMTMVKQIFVFIKCYMRKVISGQFEQGGSGLDIDERYVKKALLLSILWSFSGSAPLVERQKFSSFVSSFFEFKDLLPTEDDLGVLDYEIDNQGNWINLEHLLEVPNLGPESVIDPNTVIQTIDTLRHENLIFALLQEKRSLILCGPPGSGKTMTLYAALSRSPDIDVSNLNFSKETSPTILLKAMEQLCEYKKTVDGLIMRPKVTGKRVVFFCDEINLPRSDKFGTQHVISFMRQMIERNGFWRPFDKQWVNLVNVQFVGACNPPSDAGRIKLSPRFLSHLMLIMVDYPGSSSLQHIYNTFVRATLKKVPHLSGYAKDITNAMLDVYSRSISKFTHNTQSHYIYSPRELTRWVRGMLYSIQPLSSLDISDIIRVWAHEATRLFCDRLVLEDERTWTLDLIDTVAIDRFPNINREKALQKPIFFSNWLSLYYEPADKKELKSFIVERLKVFSDEVLDIDFVLYDDAIDHILRIDRVLKQPQGHLILVGPSGTGKTTLTKFVAWINGLKIVQLGVTRNYSLGEFDGVLKDLLKRSGVQGESICFIVDESTILDGAFLERMNSLLANSQIQEIFDQDEYNILLNLCKEQVQSRGLLLDTADELFGWFTQQVANNLHIVFTINDPNDVKSPQIISSPALFNRCVLNWMGDWSSESLIQISQKLLGSVPIDKSEFEIPVIPSNELFFSMRSFRDVIGHCIVTLHTKENFEKRSGSLIDFINSFVSVFGMKEMELQSGQRHLNSGLDKLKETVIKVKYLKEELTTKEQNLTMKEKEAREMLNKILEEQNEAERKQEASIHLQGALKRQNVKIDDHRKRVLEDLALAEPAVLEAQRGVKNIKKQHLTELRSMSTPPATVQMTLESVCILLGYDVSSWRDVQLIIRKDDFIFNIVNFDCERQVTLELRQYMEETYLSRPDYNFNSADRASKACGPLLQWVQAQVRYSIVLDQVGPLREDMLVLEEESRQNQARLLAIDDMITELQESIENYKNGYSELIRDTEKIKSEISEVQVKVQRSMKLVESLSEERIRWADSVKGYNDNYSCLPGDSLLVSAFLTYSSAVDHQERVEKFNSWKQLLSKHSISFNANLSFLDFTGSSARSLDWQHKGLTNDVLYYENVAIIEKTSKLPFIVDPLGQIVEFMKVHLQPKKLVVTSFLDDSFVKSLENTMRFGGAILIQDAEYFDPIISRLLNKDFEKVGGRRLIRLGNRNVDCSPDFKLYLHTRNPSIHITPFVRSRTTVIDFTLTESSIETQVLNMTLSHERPDVEQQRLDLVKLNGEYKDRLKSLESDLLSVLSESKGNLLDSEELVETLERLKVESGEIKQKVEETTDVMSKVDDILETYSPLAKNSSLMFSLLKKLKDIHAFYEFPLSAFMSIFTETLTSSKESNGDRVETLIVDLYKEIFANISLSLLQRDKVLIAFVMGLLYLKEKESFAFMKFVVSLLKSVVLEGDFGHLIQEAFGILSVKIDSDELDKIFNGNVKAAAVASELNINISSILPLLDGVLSQRTKPSDIRDGFKSISQFLFTGFGQYTSKYDLKDVIFKNKGSPIILASTSGFDPTYKVRNISRELNHEIKIVAMGSTEANKIAHVQMEEAAKKGGWLILQNVQTSSEWLELLQKKLDGVSLNEDFRLFLTCEVTSDIPTTLLRSSDVLVFQNAPGLKPLMVEYQKSFGTKWESGKPVEKRHIYFLLCWFHSILQERVRYVPIGFSKNYDFNDSDFDTAVFAIDKWFDKISGGRDNISPEDIQWCALQTLVGDIVYGGKVDDDSDSKYLHQLSNRIFRLESFEHDFNLINNEVAQRLNISLNPPEGRSVDDYISWIYALPDVEPPSWIGLEDDADLLMKRKETFEICQNAAAILEDLVMIE